VHELECITSHNLVVLCSRAVASLVSSVHLILFIYPLSRSSEVSVLIYDIVLKTALRISGLCCDVEDHVGFLKFCHQQEPEAN
jgi:hypothetical protein